jgi:hypothetical protein
MAYRLKETAGTLLVVVEDAGKKGLHLFVHASGGRVSPPWLASW